MQIIYLDQNQWIRFARFRNGKDEPSYVGDALVFLLEAERMGLACVPISATHYLETFRRRKGVSRADLADVMLELSGGWTIAPGPQLLESEIEAALQRRFPNKIRADDLRPQELLGRGLGHAQRGEAVACDLPDVAGISPSIKKQILAWSRERAERLALRGQLAVDGVPVPLPDLSDVEDSFAKNFEEVRSWLQRLPKKDFEDGLYRQSLLDTAHVTEPILSRYSIGLDEFASLEWTDLRSFIDELPTQRVATHVLRAWSRNPQLRVKRNDLYDWMHLMPAAAYCDIVVTEKHFAHLINRGDLQKRATVITDLRDLPGFRTKFSR